MHARGMELFGELNEYHNDSSDIRNKYARMRSLLERMARDLSENDNVQFSNLFSRLNYVCNKLMLDPARTWQLNTFRINANKVLHGDFEPGPDVYMHDLKAVCQAISHFYGIAIPKELFSLLPGKAHDRTAQRQKEQKHSRIRFTVEDWDGDFIYGFDEDHATDQPVKIRYHVAGVNDQFDSLIPGLWKGSQLNLLDVTIAENGTYTPEFIVLEPDYLLDISALAECFRDYGSHPLNYLMSKFDAVQNTKHILLGNAANLFLDELVNEKPENPVSFEDCIKKVFRSAAFEFSSCDGIDREFFENARDQFQKIRDVVTRKFPSAGYDIDRTKAILEPSFICEHLGLQGRMDFLLSDFSRLIELKSGKANENYFTKEISHKENHYVQMNLYQAVLYFNLNVKPGKTRTYLLYSKYPELFDMPPLWGLVKQAINLRNQIIINELKAKDGTGRSLLKSITPDKLNQKNMKGKLWDSYISPQIRMFTKPFNDPDLHLELDYFLSFYAFVTREHLISRSGGTGHESGKGISSLWLSSLTEKIEAGEILTDLKISENAADEQIPAIRLNIPRYEQDFLPNFREGDIIILYERNRSEDSVTNRQVFKGVIGKLEPESISIRLRSRQRNLSVLPAASRYAIEHDFLDSSYNGMFRGLYSFMLANRDRRDLLLNRRVPQSDPSVKLKGLYGSNEINDIVLRAKQARDYFILIGPPGTGKTSIALKSMVEEFHSDPSVNILLLAFTNRAVDEVCDALDRIVPQPQYVRVGSELACLERHRHRLLEKVIEKCDNREQVVATIRGYRIFTGTVSSLSGKPELFKLKSFDIAIVDEASQILEPQIIGLLSAKNGEGGNAIGKFILIGDHKQMPAVVQQSEKDSWVGTEELRSIGLKNRRNSLFERLFSQSTVDDYASMAGILRKQYRMHPEIARFPNYAFYNNDLTDGDAPHQNSPLEYSRYNEDSSLEKLIATTRLAFIPSEKCDGDQSNKTNSSEARIAATLLKTIFDLHQKNAVRFIPEECVGIITPYRSQIALIRREIHQLGIPELTGITVDTVERFQGSQRKIIIYSFSINQYYQLDFIANNVEEDGVLIDRKLNVAITRAKEQLFITGNPAILSNNLTYFRLMEYIRSKGGYIDSTPDEFIAGRFPAETGPGIKQTGIREIMPDPEFTEVFNRLVIEPVKSHPKTEYPGLIYGNDADFNRVCLIGYGRADYSLLKTLFGYTLEEKINIHCYYNLRRQYYGSRAICENHLDLFGSAIKEMGGRITFLDLASGPAVSGLAFYRFFGTGLVTRFHYAGIDESTAMRSKAAEFLSSGIFGESIFYTLESSLLQVADSFFDTAFATQSLVIINYSDQFTNSGMDKAADRAAWLNRLMERYPLNRYMLIYQNSVAEKAGRSYSIFRKMVFNLKPVSTDMPKNETVRWVDVDMNRFDNQTKLYYEILSN